MKVGARRDTKTDAPPPPHTIRAICYENRTNPSSRASPDMRLIACLADDSEVSSERSGGETGLCQKHQVGLDWPTRAPEICSVKHWRHLVGLHRIGM